MEQTHLQGLNGHLPAKLGCPTLAPLITACDLEVQDLDLCRVWEMRCWSWRSRTTSLGGPSPGDDYVRGCTNTSAPSEPPAPAKQLEQGRASLEHPGCGIHPFWGGLKEIIALVPRFTETPHPQSHRELILSASALVEREYF